MGFPSSRRQRPRPPLPTTKGFCFVFCICLVKVFCPFVSPALVFGFSPDQVPLDSIASHSGAKSGDYLVKIGGDCHFTM